MMHIAPVSNPEAPDDPACVHFTAQAPDHPYQPLQSSNKCTFWNKFE